jgi:hypothetical protein
MCGKAPLFRQALKIVSRGYAAVDAAKSHGGIAAQRKIDEPEKRSFSAHRAAEPQVIPI